MTTRTTPVYGLAYVDDTSPLADLAAASEQVARTTEAALVRGGIAPPAAQDLATLTGRVAAIENRGSCRRYLTASTTLGGSGTNSLPMTATQFTRGAGVAAETTVGGIKVTAAGLYLIGVGVSFTGGTAGARSVLMRVNGATVREVGTSGATDARPSTADSVPLNAGDVVSLGVFVNGTTLPTVGGAATAKDTWLSVTQL